MNVPLRCPDYSCVSRRAKSVNVSFKTPTRGEIAHLVIDSTGLKVFGEGEWKVKKHGQERRRIWRKLHLAVDSKTHEIICADLSLNNVTDSEAFPGLIRQTHRKIRSAAADGAYDTRLCHDELRRKKISALIPPRKGAGYWPGEYADRNRAVANQRMTGSNARWKWTTETYVKVNGRWAYLYRAVDSRGRTVDFYLSSRRNSKAAYRFLGKILNNVKKWQIPRFINTDKAPAYGRALALLKREGRCPSDVEHRQIKYRNNVIECDHGKLKRIIGATLGFKSMKTAYATIKGIEVMRALRKGQASAFYYGDPLGEMRLVSRVFEM